MEKYLLDIIAIAVVALCFYIGYKNGILGGIITIASAIIAKMAATAWSPLLSPYIGKIIEPMVLKSAEKASADFISKFVSQENLGDFLSGVLLKGQDATLVVATELTQQIQNIIAFLIIFVIIIVVANIVLRFLSFHMPFFKTVNRVLGGVFGLAVGVLIVVLLWSASLSYAKANQSLVSLLPYFESSYISTIMPK